MSNKRKYYDKCCISLTLRKRTMRELTKPQGESIFRLNADWQFGTITH